MGGGAVSGVEGCVNGGMTESNEQQQDTKKATASSPTI